MKEIIDKSSDEKIITISTMIVSLAIIIAVSINESNEEIYSKNGLEQCVIKNGHYSSIEEKKIPKTIWVKDCSKTLKAIRDNK